MLKLFLVISLFFGLYAGDYVAPSNTKFPLGDEYLNNNIISDPPVNELKTPNTEFKSYENCNTPTSSQYAKLNSIPCPNSTRVPPNLPSEKIYSSENEAVPMATCKRCNLNITPDNTAVIVSCFECFDFSSAEKNRTSKDFVYQAYYLQLSNYTSVDRNYHNVNNMQAAVIKTT